MSRFRNPSSIHVMNRYVDQLTNNAVTIHDLDCIFRNHAKEFWCMFEWKNLSESQSRPGTMQSLNELDEAFNNADADYKGLFIVRLGFHVGDWELDDDKMIEVQHIWGGFIAGHKTYETGARSALQYILDHGRLL